MPKQSLPTTVFLIITLLATGCTTEPPKCSDNSTLDLVRKILLKNMDLSLNDAEMQAILKFEYPRATAIDEKIKKYSCESKLIAGDSIELPITYESQLDDQNRHLVGLGHISMRDGEMVEGAVREKLQMQAVVKNASASVTPSAGLKHPIAGLWRGKLEGDGEMQITATRDGFDVVLDVSAENCAGNIEGSAQLNGKMLTLRKKENDQTCIITANFNNDQVKVSEDDCMPYHGMACGFSGTLEKVK